MCGIFGYCGLESQAAELVLAGLKRLEYRGYDSWGVAVLPNQSSHQSNIVIKKAVGKIGEAQVAELPAGNVAMGHTRWATHGGVTQLNAHPHLDCSGQVAVIHNGVVENYEPLQVKLLKNHSLVSQTDTELIAHLIEDQLNNHPFEEAVRLAFLELEGLNAVVAMHAGVPKLVAIRRGSPLVIGFGQEENYLASDPAALVPHTQTVYSLEEEEMVVLAADAVEIKQCVTGVRKQPILQQLTWTVTQAEKGSHPFFMEKEIWEQPAILETIATSTPESIEAIAARIRQAQSIYLVGCGTAGYAAMVGAFLFNKTLPRPVTSIVGSEFALAHKQLSPNDLVIALSQSGETMDLLESLKSLKTQGVPIVALVNVVGSSLARLADETLPLNVGPEKAVATTKAFTAKIASLMLLAYTLNNRLAEGKQVIHQAVQVVNQVLSEPSVQAIQALAKQLKTAEHLFVLGRGLSYPLSLEAALKLKEIAYLHAEGLASGELKHGPLALVEPGTPCLVFLPDDETYSANLASAREVKARGGVIIGVSFKPQEVFDIYLEVLPASEATLIPNVVVAQLLAYYLALEKGLDPDMPRNLAKSVTVK